jgi:hypothetical protein
MGFSVKHGKKLPVSTPNHHKLDTSFSYHGCGWVSTIHKASDGKGFVVKVSYGEGERCFFKQQYRAASFALAETKIAQMIVYNSLVSIQPIPEELARLIAWNFKDRQAISQMGELIRAKKLELEFKMVITIA